MPNCRAAASFQARLAPFLEINPDARYRTEGGEHVITSPWGDPTVEFQLDDDAEELIAALNSVYLPRRFSALWHRSTRDLEFIFGPIPLNSELLHRSFEFRQAGLECLCEFGNASRELTLIAEATRTSDRSSETNHRNLLSLRYLQHLRKKHPGETAPEEVVPTSFWIRGIDWDEERILLLARHLNFYMHYFDRHTPQILIHEETPKNDVLRPPARFPRDRFPSVVSGRSLDSDILQLWESSIVGDTFQRFLHSYQILEYAGFYHLEDQLILKLQRIIIAPDTPARASQAARQIRDLMVVDTRQESAKIRAAIEQLVTPDALWPEITRNREYFLSEVSFDGGLTIKPLVKNSWELEDFRSEGHQQVHARLSQMRNGLVHVREQRTEGRISPSSKNVELLRPWLSLLTICVEQIIVHWK